MRPSHRTRRTTHQQRGLAVLEFALVFTVVWAVFWSLVCYVAPLIVLQTMHRATAEGARVGAMITNHTQRASQAKAAADEEMRRLPSSWLGGYTAPNVTVGPVNPDGTSLLTVTITQPYAANAPLKPIINLPGVGTIPALPQTLRSEVTLLLN